MNAQYIKQNNVNELVKFFFTLQLTLKNYHWNTTSFARHNASNELGGKLATLIDKFIELFIGRYKVKPVVGSIKIDPLFVTDGGAVELLNQAIAYLEGLNNMLKDVDLLTVRDELVGELNQTLYLYQLK
jgi:hypothetical protein